MYKAIRFAGGFRRLLRSLTRKIGTKREWIKRTERSTILGANRRLANATGSMLKDTNSDAARMYLYLVRNTKAKKLRKLLQQIILLSPTTG